MAITATEGETAAVTFLGTFFSALLIVGTTITQAAEVAAVAALGVLGYHVVSGNISLSSAAPKP